MLCAISYKHNKDKESCIFSFCVHPNYQGKGIGKKLMKELEKDDYYKRSDRIEVSSSIPALPFYLKLGFKYKNNEMTFENGSFYLEKYK